VQEPGPAPQTAAVVGQRRCAVPPSAGSGCRRLIPGVAPAGAPVALPREVRAPVPMPAGLPHEARVPARVPVLPALRNSVRHSGCAAAVPHRPARPKAWARWRWSEVWQSY